MKTVSRDRVVVPSRKQCELYYSYSSIRYKIECISMISGFELKNGSTCMQNLMKLVPFSFYLRLWLAADDGIFM